MNIVNSKTENPNGSHRTSYSSLSNLAKSPKHYKLQKESAENLDDNSAVLLGSVVDILLTDKDKFDEEYYVMTASKPSSDAMLNYCKALVETGDSVMAHIASGYKISGVAVATKFEKEGRAYYDALIEGKDKKIIDAELLFTANTIISTLKSNPFTKDYFVEKEGIELFFQVEVYWDIEFISLITGAQSTMRVKSILDILRIDHDTKTIKPVDLKTGAEGFFKAFWKYHRYLQGSMYTDAILMAEWDQDISGYTVDPIRFVYADSNCFNPPLIYKLSPNDIAVGREGVDYFEPFQGKDGIRLTSLGQKKRKGYIQLAAELDWHLRTNQWDYEYSVFKNNGEIEANAFSIKL